MAVYERTNTSFATTATMPSKDLGSVIVQSLQSAVESIKGENSDETSLKDSIREGIDSSAIMKALRSSSTKISESFKKTNTKAQGDKNSPSEKVSKNMDDIAGLLKADDKREKERDKEAKITKKTEKNHKSSVKEGFSAVKAFGSAMLQKIGLVLLGLQLLAELIVLIKYGWHYLMGVFIPKTWAKIKISWSGFWAKITTQIKNFFIGLWDKLPGVDARAILDEEDYKRIDDLTKKIQGTAGGKEALDKVFQGLKDKKVASEALDTVRSQLKEMGYGNLTSQIDTMSEKLERGKNISTEMENLKGFLTGLLSDATARGDSVKQNKLESLLINLDDYDFKTLSSSIGNIETGTKTLKELNLLDEVKELTALMQGKHDPEIEKLKAEKKASEEVLQSGNYNTMVIEDLRNDESIGKIVKDTMDDLGPDGIKVKTDDKHFKWLNDQGYEWLKTISDMVNHATQNIGINVSVPNPPKYKNNPAEMSWFKKGN